MAAPTSSATTPKTLAAGVPSTQGRCFPLAQGRETDLRNSHSGWWKRGVRRLRIDELRDWQQASRYEDRPLMSSIRWVALVAGMCIVAVVVLIVWAIPSVYAAFIWGGLLADPAPGHLVQVQHYLSRTRPYFLAFEIIWSVLCFTVVGLIGQNFYRRLRRASL